MPHDHPAERILLFITARILVITWANMSVSDDMMSGSRKISGPHGMIRIRRVEAGLTPAAGSTDIVSIQRIRFHEGRLAHSTITIRHERAWRGEAGGTNRDARDVPEGFCANPAIVRK